MSRPLLFRVIIVLVTSCILLVVGEVWARVFLPPHKKLQVAFAGAPLVRIHRFDPGLGWTGLPGVDVAYPGTRAIRVRHNSEGFRDAEHSPASAPSWLFLGDSFTWGFDVEAEERFTDLIARTRPAVRVLNAGVSGYDTAQEYLLYLRLRTRRPRLVVLLFGGNDRAENQKDESEAGYAVPRFAVRGGTAVLERETVPRLLDENAPQRPTLPWYRSHLWDHVRYRAHRMQRYFAADPTEHILALLAGAVRADGARLAVLVEKTDPGVVARCRALEVPVLELGPLIDRARARGVTHYAGHGDHWTPLAHRVVAEAAGPFLDRVAAGR